MYFSGVAPAMYFGILLGIPNNDLISLVGSNLFNFLNETYVSGISIGRRNKNMKVIIMQCIWHFYCYQVMCSSLFTDGYPFKEPYSNS